MSLWLTLIWSHYKRHTWTKTIDFPYLFVLHKYFTWGGPTGHFNQGLRPLFVLRQLAWNSAANFCTQLSKQAIPSTSSCHPPPETCNPPSASRQTEDQRRDKQLSGEACRSLQQWADWQHSPSPFLWSAWDCQSVNWDYRWARCGQASQTAVWTCRF